MNRVYRFRCETLPTVLTLNLLDGELAVSRLPPEADPPAWAWSGPIQSVTRTRDELSVVCAADAVPDGVTTEGPWRALSVAEKLDFYLTGIAAGLTKPLAAAGVSVFFVATHDTDHLLVKSDDLAAAIGALEDAGIRVQPPPGASSTSW